MNQEQRIVESMINGYVSADKRLNEVSKQIDVSKLPQDALSLIASHMETKLENGKVEMIGVSKLSQKTVGAAKTK